MTLRPRSLYTKIFLWFCFTIAASTLLVLTVAGLTTSQPLGRRWMAVTQDLYAHSAVDFYITGGDTGLTHYLDTLARSSGVEGHLLDAQGSDVLGGPFPERAAIVYRSAQTAGSVVRLGRYWTAASVVAAPDGRRFTFVMEAHPLHGFIDGTFISAGAPRILGGVVLVALFCLLLARHITQPIRILQSAATRMAAGDLSVRTLPAMRPGRVDELAAMAAAFDSMAERIETLLRTQRQMLADISHELRSPLTRIGVSLELLRRGQLDVVEPIQADLDRLNGMISQVLELARFELQVTATPTSAVDLRPMLEDIIESANYEGRTSAKSVHLTASLATAHVVGEEGALRSCIENVIRNAVQYSPAGAQIAVSLSQTGRRQLVLLVEDDGPGVPEELLPQLLTPFFRVPATAAVHPLGNGLGLSIASRVAARCGGAITATNRSPHGLAVRLTLPCVDCA